MKNKGFISSIYAPITRFIHESWAVLFPANYARYFYRKASNKELNLKDPRDYNEKLEWLKIYSDTSLWTECADKYKVRKYIHNCGFDHILTELYGVWKAPDEIDFSVLPDKFVLKANHGFGKTMVVRDKSQLNIIQTRRTLKKWLRDRYGLMTFEPHHWNIDRRIIAEELLQDEFNKSLSSSLIDYKFWCVNGEPEVVVTMLNRQNVTVGSLEEQEKSSFKAGAYDLNWNLRPEILTDAPARQTDAPLPKPNCFDEMIRICKVLSKPFPTVRVDLYEVNNRVYFGELTFTPGGNKNYFSDEIFLKMGEKIDLSSVKLREKRFII